MSTAMPLLIQVVASLQPGRNGVADHALALAQELESVFGVRTAFAVVNSKERGGVPYPTVFCAPSELLKKCLELTEGRSAALLAHVSGYGYAPDGAPSELAEALAAVRASGRLLLGSYFHELYATGMPWRSAFWHTRRQQQALRRIAVQCGLVVTNLEDHAAWLEQQGRGRGGFRVERLPVFSTIGEAEQPVGFAQRDPALVVFGQPGSREASYRQLTAAGPLVEALGVEEIRDVGPECNHPSQVRGVQVKRVGMLAAEQIPAIFARARFGVQHHPWRNLAKSSIFAAYCAHGVVPVVAGAFPRAADGLEEGVQVVTPRTPDCAERRAWERRSRAAWDWYRSHCVRAHAERYAQWMGVRA